MAPRAPLFKAARAARLERRNARSLSRAPWHRAAVLRRTTLAILVVGQTAFATHWMSRVMAAEAAAVPAFVWLGAFALLFAWVSACFWTAIAGFVVLVRGGDRFAISRTAAHRARIDSAARTAIVMPICNENVQRVFAGLAATYRSLARTGELERFDLFVLSDSADPDTRVAEMHAWLELCRELGAFGRLFYRWRQHRIKKKAGNIADFCRRWGRRYRYMVVLDADSVMSGECLVALVQLMEANPRAGIIQAAPRAAGRQTLHARMQQFASRVYGPLFIAGMHFWELGEAHYWGHNAIIRVAPFMRHCALGRLPGRGALATEILSHDFVEAALMRGAGWGVWLAYDLPGSYEEMPPNLVDELKRDRRWCVGNLINSRLIFARGLHPAHRAVFMTGVMAYASALLWCVFLAVSTVFLAVPADRQFSFSGGQPMLLGMTLALLVTPKLLAMLLVLLRDAESFGGPLHLVASGVLEFVVAALLAPIRMLFHTQFVLGALTGLAQHWKSPPREDVETTWREAARHHGWQTAIGVSWAAAAYLFEGWLFWWLLPVVGALALSIPLSVLTSRVSLGRRLRDAGIFVIPEERNPPQELEEVARRTATPMRYPSFVDAVLDPQVHALTCTMRPARRQQPAELKSHRHALVQRARTLGPQALSRDDQMVLLCDPLALSRLRNEILAEPHVHRSWRTAAGAWPGLPSPAQPAIREELELRALA